MHFSPLLAAISTNILSITLHLSQQIDILNPSLNNFDNFVLSSADKVTIGT